MISYVIFYILLAATAYVVNYVAKFDDKKFKIMANVFMAIIAILNLLIILGVGR